MHAAPSLYPADFEDFFRQIYPRLVSRAGVTIADPASIPSHVHTALLRAWQTGVREPEVILDWLGPVPPPDLSRPADLLARVRTGGYSLAELAQAPDTDLTALRQAWTTAVAGLLPPEAQAAALASPWLMPITRWLADDLSPQEDHELRHWMDQDPAHVALFDAVYEAWEASAPPPPAPAPDVTAAWEAFRAVLPRTRRRWPASVWMGATAMLLAAASIGWLWFVRPGEQYQADTLPLNLQAAAGYTFHLMPGSTLTLRGDEATLAGEATIYIRAGSSLRIRTEDIHATLGPGNCVLMARPDTARLSVSAGEATLRVHNQALPLRTGQTGVWSSRTRKLYSQP
ncbi:MAG: hypothetical protein SF053_07385 [Bacteroidia bacterium]|nr:hypothetical protein [Bacteroidia bacterium]